MAAAAACLALLAAEAGLRVRAALEDRGLIVPGAAFDFGPPPSGEVELGHMIRPAREPRVIYRLRPNLDVLYRGGRVRTNRYGLRGPEVAEAVRPGTVRVVGLGDSFMFGYGVDDREPYLEVLSRELGALEPGTAWEVVNLAVPGYNTVMEVARLEADGLRFRPQLVILEFVGNDLTLPNFVRTPRPVLALDRSFLVDAVRRASGRGSLWQRLLGAGLEGVPQNEPGSIGDVAQPDRVPPELRDLVGWPAYERATARLAELAADAGFRVLVISLDPEGGPLVERVFARSRELGFAVRDLGGVIAKEAERRGLDPRAPPFVLSTSDLHPSALAHRVAGEALARTVLELRPALGAGPARPVTW